MFSVIFASEDTPGQEEFPDQGSPKSQRTVPGKWTAITPARMVARLNPIESGQFVVFIARSVNVQQLFCYYFVARKMPHVLG